MKLLLDTCAILWAVSEPERISDDTRRLLESPDCEVLVSPISCAEIACAVERNKISLDRHWKTWVRHFLKLNEWMVVPIDLNVMEEAYSLPPPFHQDPADRLIVATARLSRATIVTGDKRILEYPHADSRA